MIIEILNFIFQSFWTFAGTVVLIMAIGAAIAAPFAANASKRVKFDR